MYSDKHKPCAKFLQNVMHLYAYLHVAMYKKKKNTLGFGVQSAISALAGRRLGAALGRAGPGKGLKLDIDNSRAAFGEAQGEAAAW